MNIKMFSELFGGTQRFKALRTLYENSDRSFGARELASESDVDYGNLRRWLARWVGVGLVSIVGKDRLQYKASDDPALVPLIHLFKRSSALVDDIRNAISVVAGVDVAFIFGSFAGGRETAKSDVDIFVVGDLSELKLNAMFKPLSRKYNKSINVSVFSRQDVLQQLKGGDEIIKNIIEAPMINLKGTIDGIKSSDVLKADFGTC